jgi:hypothetical protein
MYASQHSLDAIVQLDARRVVATVESKNIADKIPVSINETPDQRLPVCVFHPGDHISNEPSVSVSADLPE